MNKIYGAFDSIKLRNEIKKNIYQNIKLKKDNTSYRKYFMSSSLALVLVTTFIFAFIGNLDSSIPENAGGDLSTFTTSESINDTFLYKGEIYSRDDSMLDITVKDNVGVLKQISSNDNLANDFDSYYHNGGSVYSTNEDIILIVKIDGEDIIYRKQ